MTLRDYLDDEHLSYLWNKIKAKFLSLSGGSVSGSVDITDGVTTTTADSNGLLVNSSSSYSKPVGVGYSPSSYYVADEYTVTKTVRVGITEASKYPVQYLLDSVGYDIHPYSVGTATISIGTGDADSVYSYNAVIHTQSSGGEEDPVDGGPGDGEFLAGFGSGKVESFFDDVFLKDSNGVTIGRVFRWKVRNSENLNTSVQLWYAGAIKSAIDSSLSSGQVMIVQFQLTLDQLVFDGYLNDMTFLSHGRESLPVFKYNTVPYFNEVPYKPSIVAVSNGDVYFAGDSSLSKLNFVSKSGDTMTDSLSFRDNDTDRDATLSGDVYGKSVRFLDKDGELTGLVRTRQYNNDAQYLQLAAFNEKSDGTEVSNFLEIIMKKDGTKAYSVGNAQAFREAIRALTYIGEVKTGSDLNAMPWGAIWWGQNFTNAPDAASGSTYWYRIISYDGVQIAMRFIGNTTASYLYIRTYTNSVWQPWSRCDNNECLKLSGGTMTGNIRLRTQNYSANTTAPSSTVDQDVLNIYDKDGRRVWVANYWHTTANVLNFRVWAQRYINGTTYYNMITLGINGSGGLSVSVSSASAWRSAIGAAASSDRRLKSDISPLGKDAVEFVDNLEPCVYTINGERQVGLIAQDVHEADPWGTRMAFETQEGIDGLDDWEKMEDGSPTWKLDYIRIIPPLVAAVKEANSRIAQLEAEMSELRAIVDGNDLR